MVDIRIATIGDIKVIREIAYKTWPSTFRDILSPGQIDYMLEMMYSYGSLREQISVKNHIFLIASIIVNGKITETGYCSYEKRYSGENKIKIHKLYVLPEFQNTGSGRTLISKVESVALENNYYSITLNVNRNNKAVEFYQKRGFSVIKEEIIPIGNGFVMDDCVMEKNIIFTKSRL